MFSPGTQPRWARLFLRRTARALVFAALPAVLAFAPRGFSQEADPKNKIRVKWDPVERILEFEDALPPEKHMVYYYYHVQHQAPMTVKSRIIGYVKPPGSVLLIDEARRAAPSAAVWNNAQYRHNILIFKDTRPNIERYKEILRRFVDVPRPQVLIEAKITEITYTRTFEFGFEGAFESVGERTFFRGFDLTFNPVSFLDFQRRSTQGSAGRVLPFQGMTLNFQTLDNTITEDGRVSAVGDPNAPAAIRMLARNGKVQILSRPRIMVEEGGTGILTSGDEVPRQLPSTSANGVISFSYKALNVTTTLTVKPDIIGENTVSLEVNPTFVEVIGFTDPETSGGIANPISQTRSIKTRAFLRDRQTLIIGGLFSDSYIMDTAEIPFLGDIPIVGQFFKSHRRQRVKTELVFFLTPTIFRPDRVTPDSVFVPSGAKRGAARGKPGGGGDQKGE